MLEINTQKRVIAFKATSNKPINESFLQNNNSSILSKDTFVSSKNSKKPSLISFLGNKIQENETLQKFKKHIKFMEGFAAVLNLFEAREETGTVNTKRSPEKTQELMEKLDNFYGDYYVAPELKRMVKKLSAPKIFEKLNDYDKDLVTKWVNTFNAPKSQLLKDPISLSPEENALIENANKLYATAKNNDDFETFKPALKAILKSNIDRAQCRSEKPYDYVLDQRIKGATTRQLDKIFSDLKDQIVPMVKDIQEAKASNTEKFDFSFLNNKVETSKIIDLAKEVVADMGYDFSRGGLYKTVHPVTYAICAPTDVRITVQNTDEQITMFEAMDILASAMHEAGHAMVYQGADNELRKTGLIKPENTVNEAQARLWEVMVGKSEPFLKYCFPKLKKIFPEALKDVSFEQFYRAVNNVEATPIRTSSDELTYNLHIMLRYELEKELFNGHKDLDKLVEKLPERWNSKTKKYLGFTPKNNKEGILQDVHYSYEYFGYFPSYTLGNLLAAQTYEAAKEQIPDIEKQIEAGNFKPLKDFLTKNMYKNGCRGTYNEIAQKVTGKELSSEAFVNHVKTKFSEVYGLKNKV